MSTKEHLKEVEDYIRSSDDYWVDLNPKLNEMMVSYSEFYHILKGLVDDNVIKPNPNSNYGTLRFTMRQELVVEPDLRFRLCRNDKSKQEYHPTQKDKNSVLKAVSINVWWKVFIPILILVIFAYIQWKWLNEFFN